MARKIIAALEVSVDGFIEGPNGEMDWAMMEDEETWKDIFEMLAHVDIFILGRKMYPGYEQYWLAVLADPGGILPFSGRRASKNEIAYAYLAIADTISFFPVHWIRSPGRRRKLFGMWKTSEK